MKNDTIYVFALTLGIILALGPFWGLAGTILGMIRAFGEVAEAEPEASALAGNISFAMRTTIAGFIACPFGIALIVIARYAFLPARDEEDSEKDADDT